MISEKKSSSGQDGGISRSKWDILGRLADRYDQTERARIDAAKDSLRDEPISLYDSYGSGREAISPTRAKKIGIALLDAAGLRFGRLEERRERDARRAAKSELAKEFQALDAASVMTFSDDSEMPKSENPYPDLGKQDELPHKPDVQITDVIEPIENEEARLERQREIREKLENDLNE